MKTNHNPILCVDCGDRKVRFVKDKKLSSIGKRDAAQPRQHWCRPCAERSQANASEKN